MPSPWTIAPNWTNGVTETLSWLTNLMQSQSGAEQRQGLRLSPRRTIEYDFLCDGAQRTLFDLMMTSGGGSDWLLPLWFDGGTTTARFNAGSPGITIDTTDTEFANATQVLIYGDAFTYEVMTISAMSATTLSFVEVTSKDWPQGTRVYPLRPARFTDQPSMSKQTASVASGTVRFQMTGNNDFTPDFGAVASYLGIPVVTDDPNVRDGIDLGWERLIVDNDADTGIVVRTDTAGIGFILQKHPMLLVGKAEHAAFRRRLYAHSGMLNVVWLPTFNSDLTLVSETRGATMLVQMCGYSLFGNNTIGRKDIMIEMYNGTRYFATISHGEVVDSATERLYISVADFGLNIVPALVKRISFIYKARLASDTTEIIHQTDTYGASESTLAFRSTPEIRNVV